MVILYGGELTHHAFEKNFSEKSAFDLVCEWASSFSDKIILFTKSDSSLNSQISELISSNPKIQLLSRDSWSKSLFISQIASVLKENSADNAIVAWADTPFINAKITGELLEMQEKYSAEYTFADGFPEGFAPEILASGTASILSDLSQSSLKGEGEKNMSRDALFSVMKGDINSFEIETLISDRDYRLFRFNFESSSKINSLACKNLYQKALAENVSLDDLYALADLAAKTPSVMQTVPAFYNIQISSKFNHKYCYSLESAGKNPSSKEFMSLSDFKKILSQIKDFSENAVVSLSAFGEPLLNPDFFAL